MKIISNVFKNEECYLVGIGFLLSCLFLFAEWRNPITKKEVQEGGHAWMVQGYNFYKYGISNKVSNLNVFYKDFKVYGKQNNPLKFNTVSIYDPIFYSAFCALLWRLLGASSLWSLRILNIIVFSFLMVWLFRVLLLLFNDTSKAFYASLGVLLFLPLVYTNIINPRDVHHYYFFIFFFYALFSYVFSNKSLLFVIGGALGIVFCQWVRPPLLSSFVVLSGLMLLWAYIEPKIKERTLKGLSIFWFLSVSLFWVPFCTFNKITYNKYFLSALGENMLSSLYGTSYPNGDIQEHSVAKFVERKTGLKNVCATLKGDDLCLEIYKGLAWQYPMHAFKCMILRVKQMLWYDLPWRKYDPYITTKETSRFIKLKLAFSSLGIFLEFFARIYTRLLLIFGYLGMWIAFLKKEYKILVFMGIGVIFSSGYSWLFHIEERVLAVHNWPFGLFAAYGIIVMYEFLVSCLSKKNQKRCVFLSSR